MGCCPRCFRFFQLQSGCFAPPGVLGFDRGGGGRGHGNGHRNVLARCCWLLLTSEEAHRGEPDHAPTASAAPGGTASLNRFQNCHLFVPEGRAPHRRDAHRYHAGAMSPRAC